MKKGMLLLSCALAITVMGISHSNVVDEVVNAESLTYDLVEDVSKLAAGDKVIIAAAGYNMAMSATQGDNNRAGVAITKSSDKKTATFNDGTVQVFTLANGNANGLFAFGTGSGYIYAAGSGKNYLKTQEEIDKNSSFAISINSNKVTLIQATGSSNRNIMQYNDSAKVFACYGSQSQKAVALYKAPTVISEDEVKVTYDSQDGTTVKASVVTKGQAIGNDNKPANPSKDGYAFAGWYTDTTWATPYDFTSAVNDNITVYAKWESYAVSTFAAYKEAAVGSFVKVKGEVISNYLTSKYVISDGNTSIKIDDSSKKLMTDVKVGNEVSVTVKKVADERGVMIGATQCELVVTDASDVTINATPKTSQDDVKGEGEYVSLSEIKLTTANSSNGSYYYRTESGIFTILLNQKFTEGFNGVTSDFNNKYVNVVGFVEALSSTFQIVASKVEVCATKTVTFDSKGGSSVAPISVLVGHAVNVPSDPTKAPTDRESYTFDSWYTDENCTQEYDFDTPVTADITLYAKWNVNRLNDGAYFAKTTKTKTSFEFDYDKRTHYLTDGHGYSQVDLNTMLTDEDNYDCYGYMKDDCIRFDEDGAYISWLIPEGHAADSFTMRITAYATGSGESSFYFVTWNEVEDENGVYDEYHILQDTDSVELATTSGEFEYTFNHLGSATHVGIVCEKMQGSNVMIEKVEVGTDHTTTYENFRNMKMNFSCSFDIPNYAEVAETGIMVSRDNEAAALSLLEQGLTTYNEGLTKYVNSDSSLKFTVSIDVTDEDYLDTFVVAGYVKLTDGTYYYADIADYSMDELLAKYAANENESLSRFEVMMVNELIAHIEGVIAA